jgi:formate/nitrite transporter FocA (FNT family)
VTKPQTTKWPVHPIADLFPMMTDEELADLAADIKANGLIQPIVLDDGRIIDGRNRAIGALIFPVGLVMIVLLGLELITGSFALLPLPWLRGEATGSAVIANWGWVFLGNLIGSVAYGALLAIALTDMGAVAPAGVAARLVAAAEAKTTGYEAFALPA